jgi:hypothetical protein
LGTKKAEPNALVLPPHRVFETSVPDERFTVRTPLSIAHLIHSAVIVVATLYFHHRGSNPE